MLVFVIGRRISEDDPIDIIKVYFHILVNGWKIYCNWNARANAPLDGGCLFQWLVLCLWFKLYTVGCSGKRVKPCGNFGSFDIGLTKLLSNQFYHLISPCHWVLEEGLVMFLSELLVSVIWWTGESQVGALEVKMEIGNFAFLGSRWSPLHALYLVL